VRRARISVKSVQAGILEEIDRGKNYLFRYDPDYDGSPVSLTMPTSQRDHEFHSFPPFFDGVLPEGVMMEALLKQRKIDRDDPFSQLVAVGEDLVGAVTVRETE
jgi:serine/threonine-protein kinase HipA